MKNKIEEFNKKYQLREVELRDASVQENDGKMILEGYAVVFNSPTVLFKCGETEYKEIIDAKAFDDADMSDCCLKYNHGGMLLARTRGESLKLTIDEKGLFFHAELFDTSVSRDVYKLVKEGGLDKCSFAFSVKEHAFNEETTTRTILKVEKLYDVAVVDIPAYKDTSVSARSLFEMEIKKREQELENSKLRERLIVESYL